MKNKLEDLRNIINLESLFITSCSRLFFDSRDSLLGDLSDDSKDLEMDGNVYLFMSNDSVLVFYPITESFETQFELLNVDAVPNNLIDISDNPFWQKRLGQKILNTTLIFGEYTDNPYGIKIDFENNLKVSIYYVSQNEYTFDALIIRDIPDIN